MKWGYKSNDFTGYWDQISPQHHCQAAAIMLAAIMIAGPALVLTTSSEYTYSDFSFEMDVDYGGGGYGGWEIDTFSLESNYF